MCSAYPVVFIAEITARAFIIADSNKRRTLSRADIAKALSKSDQFDFLIDIVPREEPPGGAAAAPNASGKPQKKAMAGNVRVLNCPYMRSSSHAFASRPLKDKLMGRMGMGLEVPRTHRIQWTWTHRYTW